MRSSVAAALAAAALAPAGCGGSDDQARGAATAWADSLCTSLVAWTDAVRTTGAELRDTQSLTAEAFAGALDDAVEATRTLVDEIGALEAPEIGAGAEAGRALAESAAALSDDADVMEQQLADAAGELPGLSAKAAAIGGTLSSMSTTVSGLFRRLGEIDAAGELEQGFLDADACRPIVDPS